jgi:hypothetical protein
MVTVKKRRLLVFQFQIVRPRGEGRVPVAIMPKSVVCRHKSPLLLTKNAVRVTFYRVNSSGETQTREREAG